MAKKTQEAEKAKFGTGIFFIEDPKFFEALQKKVTDKANKDDFIFGDAIISPEKVFIRMRDEKWAVKTTSNRGNITGDKGDFLLKDPGGNKLCVNAKLFNEIYLKIIG